MEKQIGKVIHIYNKAMVAVVKLDDNLSIGDAVKFSYQGNEFIQNVDSMQVNYEPVDYVESGKEVAIKLEKYTRKNASVYKIIT